MTLTVGALSLGTTARVMARFGPERTVLAGLAIVVAALLALSGAGEGTSYLPGLFVAYALMGVGMGTAMLPLLTIAMSGVPERDAGLASGIVNVSMQLAGALGIAILGTLAADRTESLAAAGASAAERAHGRLPARARARGGERRGRDRDRAGRPARPVGAALERAQRSPSRSDSRGGEAPARSHVRAATTHAKRVASRTAVGVGRARRGRGPAAATRRGSRRRTRRRRRSCRRP